RSGLPQNIAEFEWWVPPRGYVWADEPVLVPIMPIPPGASEECDLTGHYFPGLAEASHGADEHGRWYVPTSGLFRTFSELDGSQDEVLTFVNRYGRLGLRDPIGDR